MSNKAEIRTVLLARPGEARERLVAVLEDVGLDLALVADPLDIDQAQVLALQPHNLVIVVDNVVEDALEHFDELLALPDCRILFEDSELIAARAGWDVARWSRHLSAKLLGHGDVLPAGHEEDCPAITAGTKKSMASSGETQAALIEKPDMAAMFASELEVVGPAGVAEASASTPSPDFKTEALETPFEKQIVDSSPHSSVSITEPEQAAASIVSPSFLAESAPVPEAADETPGLSFDVLADMPAVLESAEVSDYDEYDELDAFSFLDESDIAAGTVREAEAIREAEAVTEASLPAERAEYGGLDAEALDTLWFQQQDIPGSNQESQPIDGIVQQDILMPPSSAVQAPQSLLDEDAFAFGDVLFTAEASPVTESEADCSQPSEPAETGEVSAALPEGWGFLSESGEAEAPSPADTDSGADWSIYQDFDTVTDISGEALADSAAVTDSTTEDLASPVCETLAHEDAYQRIADELSQFEAPQLQDSWQDFERPTLEAEAAPQILEEKPPEPLESPFAGGMSQWSLSDVALTIDAGSRRPAFEDNRLKVLEQRIASLSLVKTEEEELAEAANAEKPHEGLVLLLGGIGGPDPLRQILQQLPKDFPAPVLIQQRLDSGHYDRLQRQMERISNLPIILGVPDMKVAAGKVYIVPPGMGLESDGKSRLGFVETQSRDFVDLLEVLPSASSVVVLLSGATDAFVDSLLRFQQSGGQLLAQQAEGCYDHVVPALMASRGAKLDSPTGIAMQLKALWSTTELK
ncbi:MAG: chemotaxis protein CheB [Pseudomonadota bacterium]|nr:chemotaxis protein CheB [Pseudomonadota bacterium]